MKTLSIFLSLVLSFSAYSQIDFTVSGMIFNPGTDSVFISQFFGTHYKDLIGATITKDGNFGIGTSTPTFTSGSGIEISNATQANLRVTDSNASGSSSDFAQSGNNLYIINRQSSGSINIGTNSTSTDLSIASDGTIKFNDTYTFPITDGTSGQVLETDGAGALTWTTPSSGGITSASNGLSASSGIVKLGGILDETTVISFMGYDIMYNLNSIIIAIFE